jgi:hypothetical protein
VSQESTNRSFDDLARALAEGSISRRRALKLFAGSAIAALIPSRALAGGHGKPEECDDPCICHRPPGNPQNAQTLCIPKKAREAHLKNHSLDTCGPCGVTTGSTTTSTTPMCKPNGVSCTADTQCCNGICTQFVGTPGPLCSSCRATGDFCAAEETCCSSGAICANGKCCIQITHSGCIFDEDCCAGVCDNGVCVGV